MIESWIDNYIGAWQDEEGHALLISKRDDESARVSILADGIPMKRPWMNGRSAEKMQARYFSAYSSELQVDLGVPGFQLMLNYECSEVGLSNQEALSVGVSRYESDEVTTQYDYFFGKMSEYTRTNAEQVHSTDG